MPPERPVKVAREARKSLGVGEESRLPDILRLIEDTAHIPVFLRALPHGLSGAYRVKDGAPFILVSSAVAVVRQRFTLAHEYGHHVLGHGSLLDTEETLRDFTHDPRESDANKFAAEFLAPIRAVQNWMEAHDQPPVNLEVVVRVADAFGISAASACIRLEAARFLTSQPARKQIKDAIETGEHKQLEARLGLGDLTDELSRLHRARQERKSTETWDKTLDAWEQRYIGITKAAQILGISTSELEQEIARRRIVQVVDEDDPEFDLDADDVG